MEKVYVVVEEYVFDGTEINVTIFSTLEKAKEHFNKVVETEEKNSWIADLINELADKENNGFDIDNFDSYIEKEDTYYHAYDNNDYYETTIYIEEKEIL